MTHPFRHELEAALARIEQLESALEESRGRAPLARRIFDRTLVPVMAGVLVASAIGAVGLSTVLVARMEDHREPDFSASANMGAAVRTQIITVAPRGLSSWQVSDIASGFSAELNRACGSVTSPVGINLELDISADGMVTRAHAHGPDALVACTEATAHHWVFPASDGVTHVTMPLYFRPSLAAGARPIQLPAPVQRPDRPALGPSGPSGQPRDEPRGVAPL